MLYTSINSLTKLYGCNAQVTRMKTFVLAFGLLALTSTAAMGQPEASLLDAGTRDLLHEALSGELAKEHVIAITRHHRIQGSRGYRHAANYVLDQLHSFGYSESDAYVESYPSDGRIHYQTWQSPSGWDIESAELRMIEPYDERIVGYPEIAMSLITYSNPGEATAELVWVGNGTSDADYVGKDVAGKLVLATGYGGSVHRLAVLKNGAKAVVCYLDDHRAKEYPDMLRYTGMWPKSDELDRVTFGFNLTNRQGEKLRDLLQSGKRVVLQAQVAGIGLEPYFMDIPVAVIRGSELPEEEIIFSAHLDHPKESANDNASGSAALLDMARTLRDLIDSGRLPRPKRTLRFLWVPEWHGTMAYIDKHPEMVGPPLGGKVLANINMDMVGEHLELLHSKMVITRTPDSVPSVLDVVMANMAEMVDEMNIRTPRGSLSAFNYRITPYSGGSDHMMFIDRKIPGVMMVHSPDYTHHTSEDTPDKVDPVELERAEIIATAAAWYLANLTDEQAVDLTYLAGAVAADRVGVAARAARRLISDAKTDELGTALFESLNLLDIQTHHARASVESVGWFARSPVLESLTGRIQQLLAEQARLLKTTLQSAADQMGDTAVSAVPPYAESDERIPRRATRGPLDFGLPESRLAKEEASWYREEGRALTGNVRFEIVNFVGGDRSVTDIRNLVSAEYGPISLATVSRYVEDLVGVGVLEWR